MAYLDEIMSAAKAVSRARDKFDNAKDEILGVKDVIAPEARTIAGKAMDGTLQFACLTTDSIDIDTANVLARSLERMYGSFVQTVLSLNSTIDISKDRGPTDFLKRFHNNIRAMESVSVESEDDCGWYIDQVRKGQCEIFYNESANLLVVFNTADKATKKLLDHNREMMENSLGCFDVTPIPNVGNSVFYEADEANDAELYSALTKSALRPNAAKYTAADLSKSDVKESIPKMMNDMDVKKSNDFQPYSMSVKLMAVNDRQEFVQFMTFVVGIKVILHPIHSDEMIPNIVRAISNQGRFFNFIRWTTGEKSFFADLMLNINDVKLDAANRSKGASAWWQTLKRMKERKNAYNAFFNKSKLIPNATMVLSRFEVDYIKNHYGYNLDDEKIAKKLIGALFLMGFIIVDDANQSIKILFADAAPTYQYYALSTLNREVQASSDKLGKEIVRMIGK